MGYGMSIYGMDLFAEDMMAQQAVSKEVLVKRLKRIEGQVRAIQRMIEGGDECENVVLQLRAVRSAVEGVGALVLNNFTQLCLARTGKNQTEGVDSLARAISIWGGVRVGDDARMSHDVSGSKK